MEKFNKKAYEEKIKNADRKTGSSLFLYTVAIVSGVICIYFFGVVGYVITPIMAFFLYTCYSTYRAEKIQKICLRDYQELISKRYSKEESLFIISKSFNSHLSNEFHKSVIEKVPLLTETILFFTGALPDNINDEDIAFKYLKHTTINGYKVRTDWKDKRK